MLKHAVTAVGALTTLALATTSAAAFGLPMGKRQHAAFQLIKPTDKNKTRPGTGVLRSMDGGATWHRGAGPAGSVRFLVDSPRQTNTDRFRAKTSPRRLIVPAVQAAREAVRRHRVSPSIVLRRLAVPGSAGTHHFGDGTQSRTGRITGVAVDPMDPVGHRGSVRFRVDSPPARAGTTLSSATDMIIDPFQPSRHGVARRGLAGTLQRGPTRPVGPIQPYVHVITNTGGNAAVLRRAPRLR